MIPRNKSLIIYEEKLPDKIILEGEILNEYYADSLYAELLSEVPIAAIHFIKITQNTPPKSKSFSTFWKFWK